MGGWDVAASPALVATVPAPQPKDAAIMAAATALSGPLTLAPSL